MKKEVRISPSEKAKQVAESKAQTMETRANNRKENRSKKSPIKADKDGIVYLKEGVTGPMFNTAKRDTNSAVKQERATISRCINDAYENDKGFFESINLSKTALKKTISPKTILQHATNFQLVCYYNALMDAGYIRFNVWWTLGYIKSELDGRDVNPNAVKFFEALKANDEEAMNKAFKAAVKAVAKAKAEKEAKEEK
jgi:hypothetical protein